MLRLALNLFVDDVTIAAHHGEVSSIHFLPNSINSAVISAGNDLSVKLWDLSTGQQIRTISDAHSNFISTVRYFGPEDSIIASASHDNSLKLWDFRSSENVMCFPKLHSKYITCMQVLPEEALHKMAHYIASVMSKIPNLFSF
jgi:WD40 repeat protein